jgi:flagellar protein FlgJ
MIAHDLSTRLALDAQSLEGLKRSARERPEIAAKTVAKQFDAMFIHQMLKQMRESMPQGGMLDSSQGRLYTSMFDQQVSQSMATRGVGVADTLLRHLQRTGKTHNTSTSAVSGPAPLQPAELVPLPLSAARELSSSSASQAVAARQVRYVDAHGAATTPRPGLEDRVRTALEALRQQAAGESVPRMERESAVAETEPARRQGRVAQFFDRLEKHATEASRVTGIPAKFILGQAALESGWGRREIRTENGAPSHNLFGIKATGGWKGAVAEVTTTEYIDGVAQKVKEKFRVYSSYAEAFTDYARLLTENPRYANVVSNAADLKSFAQGLQRAGYATDPNYATKIMQIVRRMT